MEIKLFREMISQFRTCSRKFPDCEIPRIGVLVGNVKMLFVLDNNLLLLIHVLYQWFLVARIISFYF